MMLGAGFVPQREIIKPWLTYYSTIDPKFDERSSFNKIRVRGFLDQENIDDQRTQGAPAYQIPPNEEPWDDTRFLIENSFVQALNEDIIKIFGTLEDFENSLGNPELLFASSYPDLRRLRDIYFNRLTGRIQIKEFFEFFRWFDDSVGIMIEQLLPKKTEFLGVQFTIESHILERAKMQYNFAPAYLPQGAIPLPTAVLLDLDTLTADVEGS